MEQRLGTSVYFCMWHWWGQTLVEKFPRILTIFTRKQQRCSLPVARHILFCLCVTSTGQSTRVVSGAGECRNHWAAQRYRACSPFASAPAASCLVSVLLTAPRPGQSSSERPPWLTPHNPHFPTAWSSVRNRNGKRVSPQVKPQSPRC